MKLKSESTPVVTVIALCCVNGIAISGPCNTLSRIALLLAKSPKSFAISCTLLLDLNAISPRPFMTSDNVSKSSAVIPIANLNESLALSIICSASFTSDIFSGITSMNSLSVLASPALISRRDAKCVTNLLSAIRFCTPVKFSMTPTSAA